MKGFILAFASPIVFVQPQIAVAQTDPTGNADGVRTGDPTLGEIGDIVVTAQRRSESLQRTPVTITVLSADLLQQKAIISESDLQLSVPGLIVRQTAGSNQFNYSIRGQTVDAYSSSNPAVLPYFNEVQALSEGATALYDLQSVQVLKGPQGTLFGRNSTGGAVLFTSTKPANEFGGYAIGRLGSFNRRSIEGAVDLPILSDRVLLRVSGLIEHRDGFQKELSTGKTIGTVIRQAGRVSLTINPVDRITNDLVIDYLHSGGSSIAAAPYTAYPASTPNLPIASTFLFSPLLDTSFGPGAWTTYLAGHPSADPVGLFQYVAKQRARGPYHVSLNVLPKHDGHNVIITDSASFSPTDNLQIKNIVGYARSKATDSQDSDGSPYGIQNSGPMQYKLDTKFFSDELQVSGKGLDNQLTFVSGVYYSRQRRDYIAQTVILDIAPFLGPLLQQNNARSRSESLAGYAQGTYDLDKLVGAEGLSATAGLRYTSEKVSSVQLPGSSFFALPDPRAVDVLKDRVDKLSWQFGLQQQVDPKTFVYVVTRRSFRSGGFNIVAPPFPGTAASGGAGFAPETATDVEVGTKLQGRVGGVAFRLNVDAYSQWVKKVQRTVYAVIPGLGTISALTVNVPEARIHGIEADGQIAPTPWLAIGGNGSFTDAKFTRSRSALFGVITDFGPYPDTPKWTGTAFAEVETPLADNIGRLSLRGDLYAQSGNFFSSLNDTAIPGTDLPGYRLVNLRLALDDVRGTGISIAVAAKNMFDKVYYAGGFATGNIQAVNSVVPGERRMVYGEVRFKW